MKYSYIIIFLFGISLSNAQEFYICDYNQATYVNTIKLIGPNFDVNSIVTIDNFGGPILDIAFSPNGNMYGVIIDTHTRIVEIDLTTGNYTVLHSFPANFSYSSVVCNANNELIMLSRQFGHLVTFNLNSLTISSAEYIGNSTPGDLTYYKGNLIFQSFLTYDILTYNGTELKTVVCGDEIPFYGISNFTTSCGQNLVYAFEPSGRIYQYDIESNNYQQVGDVFSHVSEIYGATTVNEYMASACPYENLTEVNCTVGISEELLSTLQVYPNPVDDVLYIQNFNFPEELFFTLYSTEGKVLHKDILSSEINFSHLNSGVYLMSIYNKSQSIILTKKIVKN